MALNSFCQQELKKNYIMLKIDVLVIYISKTYLLRYIFLNVFSFLYYYTIFIELSNGKLSSNDILVLPMDVTHIAKHLSFFDNVISHFGKV